MHASDGSSVASWKILTLLMTSLWSQARESTSRLKSTAWDTRKMTGLKINTTKTMMMMWSSPISEKVQVDFEELTGGATVTQEGSSE